MSQKIVHHTEGSTLADILERVLDKGIVVAGDISISIGEVELLSIKIRLVVASVDKAREMGINWWLNDPNLNANAADNNTLKENQELKKRIAHLENKIDQLIALKAAEQKDKPKE